MSLRLDDRAGVCLNSFHPSSLRTGYYFSFLLADDGQNTEGWESVCMVLKHMGPSMKEGDRGILNVLDSTFLPFHDYTS